VKPYLAIFREFWRVSFLVPGIAFFVVAIPVGIFWTLAYVESKVGPVKLINPMLFSVYPVIGCLAGFAFSLPIVQMNNRHLRLTLPKYEEKLMRATITLALGTVAFLTVSIVVIAHGMDLFNASMRWVPLFTYGAMGVGFLLTVFAPIGYQGKRIQSRTSTVIFVLTVAVLALVVVSANNDRARSLLMFALVPGMQIRLVDVLCLLTGPLLWPVYVRFLHDRRLTSDAATGESPKLEGDSERFLGRLAAMKGKTLKSELLAFHPTLLKYGPMGFVMSSLMVIGASILFALSDSNVAGQGVFPKELEFLWWYPLTVMALLPAGINAVTSATAGRLLLLPGQQSRLTLPRWIAMRFLGIWVAGACMTLLPLLAVSLWMGISGKTMVVAGLLTCLGICSFGMLMFVMHPSKDKQFVKGGFFLRLLLFFYSVAFLKFNPAEISAAYATSTCVIALLSAFSLPYVLYRMGLMRWKRMRYMS
jgi:hypothetical protein